MKKGRRVMAKNEPTRPEFQKLQEYFIWIISKLPNNIARNELLAIRDHIRLCDYISQNHPEKELVKKVKFFWDIAAQNTEETPNDLEFFSLTEPRTTALSIIEKSRDSKNPKTPYKLNWNDKKLLKSLKVAGDEPSPELDNIEDEDD